MELSEITIHKIFTENNVFFCKINGNIKSSCVKTMIKCFTLFYLYNNWLFYILDSDCKTLGLVDNNEILINNQEMVSLIKLLGNNNNENKDNKKETEIETSNWVSQNEFLEHKENNTLDILLEEIEKINSTIDIDNSDSSNSNSNSNETSSETSDSNSNVSEDGIELNKVEQTELMEQIENQEVEKMELTKQIENHEVEQTELAEQIENHEVEQTGTVKNLNDDSSYSYSNSNSDSNE